MKKAIITVALVLGSIFSYAQTVNGVKISDIDVEYIQIVGTSNLLGTKVTIQIDFGQKMKFSGKTTIVKDKEGKMVKFNSMIDALNFMSNNGYDFINSNAYSKGNQLVAHFMLKKVNN